MTTSLVWFRNDLRLHDHRALRRAIRRADHIACVYVVNSASFETTRFGFDRVGKFRLKFLRESLIDLLENLSQIGGTLHVLVGDPVIVLPKLASDIGATTVHCHREYASEEKTTQKRVCKSLGKVGCELDASSANSLYEVDDLPFSIPELPELFTKFRGKVEKQSDVQAAIPAPTEVPDLPPTLANKIQSQAIDDIATLQWESFEVDDRSVMDFRGGESEGLKRIEQYFWRDDCLREYKVTRNGMLGANYSSKFSPWLALGCLSPRHIHDEVRRYEDERTKNDSTYWMIFELLWRDYFAFIVAKHGRTVFQAEGIRQRSFPWKQNQDLFDRWRYGETGYPLIDANMRELAATGFMSNRGRQNVASFLTKNLGIDWRMGAAWFESLLIDYDPCSNYGNWNYVAGVGNDAREFRWFNTIKQSKNYDREGDYVKHWLPELTNVPPKNVHTPWELGPELQEKHGVNIGADYPNPVVDLFESANDQEKLFRESSQS